MSDAAAQSTEKARGTVERVEPTKAQRAVARRAAESKATAPHVYAEVDVVAPDGAVERMVRAAALALRDVPRLNGAYRDGAFEIYSRVNVGVLIETAEAPVVATIFDADQKEAAAIRTELDGLRERAGAGALTSPELAGGTFTVLPAPASLRSFAPILNLGQAGTLAFAGATATLACDARMISPSEAAQFLDRLREHLTSRA